MTWKELKAKIEDMDEEQVDTNVTFFDNRNEFFGIESMQFADPEFCDALDPNHPYLTSL